MPGPYTLSGRLVPNERYTDRSALTEALLPIVRAELEALVAAGCREITRRRAVDELLRLHAKTPSASSTSSTARSSRSSANAGSRTHLCFGNYKGRAVGPRRYAPMFPAFLDMTVDEIHVEMASREFAEIEMIGADRRSGRTWRSGSST